MDINEPHHREIVGRIQEDQIPVEIHEFKPTLLDVVADTREWVMDRLADPNLEYQDAMALADEFKEGINPKEDEIDILSV